MRAEQTEPDVDHRGGRLMAAGLPALFASYLLFRADQQLFGMSSDFLGGAVAAIGIVAFATGAVLAIRSRFAGPQRRS